MQRMTDQEWIDILKETGEQTGQRKVLSEVHRDGDWHRTIHAWIIDQDGRLLIQKRSDGKYTHPNMWDMSFAGHIRAGESSEQALLRECMEELGLSLKGKDAIFLFSHSGEMKLSSGGMDREINDVYIMPFESMDGDIQPDPEEVSDVKWMDWQVFRKCILSGESTYIDHGEEYRKVFQLLEELPSKEPSFHLATIKLSKNN